MDSSLTTYNIFKKDIFIFLQELRVKVNEVEFIL